MMKLDNGENCIARDFYSSIISIQGRISFT